MKNGTRVFSQGAAALGYPWEREIVRYRQKIEQDTSNSMLLGGIR